MSTDPSLTTACSIVVPVFNSHASLAELVSQLCSVLAPRGAYEILLVNDGSRDQSWDIICRLARQRPNLRGINLMRNYGQHNALLCGVRAARYPVIVTIDDDLQHPPREIPRLLEKLSEGYDVVYGIPQRRRHGLVRDAVSTISKWLLQGSLGFPLEAISAFRAFRTPLRTAFVHHESSVVSIDVLLSWTTTRFSTVTVSHDPRRWGSSQYTVRRLIGYTINLVTGFSTRPLRVTNALGFASTLLGLILLIYVLSRYCLEGTRIPGFAFLASIITIFSGVQLFVLGIIGEYLARVHLSTMRSPPYVVREDTGARPEQVG